MRRALAHLFTGACALVILACLALPWVRLNVSPSVPVGLYRLHAVPTTEAGASLLAPGHLVLFDVPERARDFSGRWRSMLKPVAAVAGEEACEREGELWIANFPHSYGAVYAENHGNPLPHLTGCLRIPDGAVFVASPVDKSSDSRYFGPVAITAIRAVATPLLLWETSNHVK